MAFEFLSDLGSLFGGGGGSGGAGNFISKIFTPEVAGGLLETGLQGYGAYEAAQLANQANIDVANIQAQGALERQQMADAAALQQLLQSLNANAAITGAKTNVEAELAQRQLVQEAFRRLIESQLVAGTNQANALTTMATLGQNALR